MGSPSRCCAWGHEIMHNNHNNRRAVPKNPRRNLTGGHPEEGVQRTIVGGNPMAPVGREGQDSRMGDLVPAGSRHRGLARVRPLEMVVRPVVRLWVWPCRR